MQRMKAEDAVAALLMFHPRNNIDALKDTDAINRASALIRSESAARLRATRCMPLPPLFQSAPADVVLSLQPRHVVYWNKCSWMYEELGDIGTTMHQLFVRLMSRGTVARFENTPQLMRVLGFIYDRVHDKVRAGTATQTISAIAPLSQPPASSGAGGVSRAPRGGTVVVQDDDDDSCASPAAAVAPPPDNVELAPAGNVLQAVGKGFALQPPPTLGGVPTAPAPVLQRTHSHMLDAGGGVRAGSAGSSATAPDQLAVGAAAGAGAITDPASRDDDGGDGGTETVRALRSAQTIIAHLLDRVAALEQDNAALQRQVGELQAEQVRLDMVRDALYRCVVDDGAVAGGGGGGGSLPEAPAAKRFRAGSS